MLPLTCTIKLWIWAKAQERKVNMGKIDWKRKLTSRKFWVSVAGLIAGLVVAFGGSKGTSETVSGCIMSGAAVIAYTVGEGLSDAAGATITKENKDNKED